MSADQSARLDLPYVAAGQMQKHVTVNEGLTRLDVLVQTTVHSRTAGPPGDPVEGDLYIAADGWPFPAGTLVRFDTPDWRAFAAPEGLRIWVGDEGRLLIRHDGGWVELGERLGALRNLERLGLAATADAANPFIARLNSALWTARGPDDGGSGDLRLVLNKSGPDRVLSLLFQSAWGGRAELGLIGDDGLSLKVSPDGSDWREALRIDAASGRVLAAAGAGRVEQHLFTTAGVWSPPAWARLLQVSAVGGGGGGRSGDQGGAGGAPGAVVTRWLPVEGLDGDLIVTPGAGGASGADGGDTLVADSTGIRVRAAGGRAGLSDGLDRGEGPGGGGAGATVLTAAAPGAAGGAAHGVDGAAGGAPGGGGGASAADGLVGGGGGGGALAAQGGAGGPGAGGGGGGAADGSLAAGQGGPGGAGRVLILVVG
jgi:hypothetical protein